MAIPRPIREDYYIKEDSGHKMFKFYHYMSDLEKYADYLDGLLCIKVKKTLSK